MVCVVQVSKQKIGFYLCLQIIVVLTTTKNVYKITKNKKKCIVYSEKFIQHSFIPIFVCHECGSDAEKRTK